MRKVCRADNIREEHFIKHRKDSRFTQPDLILLFVSCEKLKDRWTRIDWMCERLGIANYFIVSGGNSETVYDDTNHRIYLECDDSYEFLPSKILTMLEETHSRYPTAVLWKIDDDVALLADSKQFQVLEGQINHLSRIPKTSFLAAKAVKNPGGLSSPGDWCVGRCEPGSSWNTTPYLGEYPSAWANGGLSYIIGPPALEVLASTTENPVLHVLEDVMISLIIEQESKRQITVMEMPALRSQISTNIYNHGTTTHR